MIIERSPNIFNGHPKLATTLSNKNAAASASRFNGWTGLFTLGSATRALDATGIGSTGAFSRFNLLAVLVNFPLKLIISEELQILWLIISCVWV